MSRRPTRLTDAEQQTVADAVVTALATVQDPEIRRPLAELGMIREVRVEADGSVLVGLWLTIAGCPLKGTLTRDVTAAVSPVPGVTSVAVDLQPMSESQRQELRTRLRGPAREIRFAQPQSLTDVIAVASGKGGVGKSSLTVNLAVAMARSGRRVGVLDADVYGHSTPRMFGIEGQRPTLVEGMLMPITAHGVQVMSTELLKADRSDPVVWRGPKLHKALEQFLADVYWGDLDVLLLDLPPGTGDMAISFAQLLPAARIALVTTPQLAAAEVAERAGALSAHTGQQVAGVIENMAWLQCPCCDERLEPFGSGGGATTAERLSRVLGRPVPLLGSVPLDPRLRQGGDDGRPVVLADPEAPVSRAISDIAAALTASSGSLVGRSLGLQPTTRG